MEKQEIIFDSMEGKKHSVRYNTSNKKAAVSSIYVSREVLDGKAPRKIKVTIEEVE